MRDYLLISALKSKKPIFVTKSVFDMSVENGNLVFVFIMSELDLVHPLNGPNVYPSQ